MTKYLRIAATCAALILTLPLGGCMTISDAYNVATQFAGKIISVGENIVTGVKVVLPIAGREIDKLCDALNTPTDPNLPPTCGKQISAVKAGWRSTCANRALLTNDVAGDYVKKIRADIQLSQKACPTS